MKLLIPTDFSKNARRAVDFAVKIADKAHAEIVLLHAYQIIDTESPTRKLLFEEYNYSIAGKLHDELNTQRNGIASINPAIKFTSDLSDNPTRKAISEASTKILNPIFKIAELFDARIHVIVFTDTDNKEITDYARHESGLSNYQKYLKKLSPGISVTSAHLEGREFEDTLQQYIDSNSIDLLVMITRKKSFLEAIFNRSMTKKMAYRTSIPLLAVPGSDE